MPKLYVPVLKAKEGEFAALEALNSAVKDDITPLLEIPEVPFDYASGLPTKTLEQHIKNLPDRIVKAWQGRDFYLDTPNFRSNDNLNESSCALEAILSALEIKAARPIPVIRSNSSEACLATVAARSDRSACIRLSLNDFSEDADADATVRNLMQRMQRNSADGVDLLVDLGELPAEQSTALLVARSILSMIPKAFQWRHTILSAASFPEDLSGVSSRSVDRLPRREWLVWAAMKKKPALMPHRLIYSDNTISHPILKGIDPRVMRMSAAIRYTALSDWIIVKGSSVGRYGFEQYFDLCKKLVELPEYMGEGFSWGDRFIADCARSMQGPGNATTWRKVGVNHHITLVADQLSSSDATSGHPGQP